jgi:uncharacterized protein YacL
MQDVIRGIGVVWEIESLRPWLLGAIATALMIGGMVTAAHRWARRRGVDDTIGLRVIPAGRFFISLLLGLGCAAVLARGNVPWLIPVAGIELSLFLMAYFGSQIVLRKASSLSKR